MVPNLVGDHAAKPPPTRRGDLTTNAPSLMTRRLCDITDRACPAPNGPICFPKSYMLSEKGLVIGDNVRFWGVVPCVAFVDFGCQLRTPI